LFQLAESAPATAPEVDLRFTGIDLFQLPSFAQQDLLNSIFSLGRLCLMDCQVRGGYLNLVPQYNCAQQQWIALTNNTVQWTYMNMRQGYLGNRTPVQVHLRNNLFCTNVVSLLNDTNTTTWTVQDNLFDSVTVATSTGSLTNSYNGYCNTATLPSPSTGNVILTTADYQTGPLGRFYYPTNGANLNSLRNAGSRNATNACLFQYTTTPDEVKETNSIVDIGFHWVSLNSQLTAAQDTDADGVFDYAEDVNSNGGYDASAGETDWLTYNSIYGIGGGPGLVVFTPLK